MLKYLIKLNRIILTLAKIIFHNFDYSKNFGYKDQQGINTFFSLNRSTLVTHIESFLTVK